MPFVPSSEELRRLRRAIERASFREGERVFFLFSFASLLTLAGVLCGFNITREVPGTVTWAGVVGFLFGLGILYWRLRGVHLTRWTDEDADLHSLALTTRAQRAFTALMIRHAFTGQNPVARREQHDPFATWKGTPFEEMAAEDLSR